MTETDLPGAGEVDLDGEPSMRVCYIASDPRMKYGVPTGYGSHIKKTIDAFERRGIDVVRLIAGDLRDLSGIRDTYRKLTSRLPRPLLGVKRVVRDLNEIRDDFGNFRRYRKLLRGKPCDFVYERFASFRMVGYRIARSLKVPLVLEINDPVHETLRFYPAALSGHALWLEKRIVDHAAGIVVGSEALAEHYVKQGKPREQIEVIYPTADYALFPMSKAHERDTSGTTRIGFVGNIRPWHGVELLVEAFSRLRREGVSAVLDLAGDGDLMHTIRARCEELGLGESVRFLGRISYESVPDIMRSFDICVLPNATWYGSPTKFFEYGALGKPVVGPKGTPIEELIDDGVDGRLFEQGNVDDLARVLRSLCDDPGGRSALGSRLATKLHSEITWEENTERVLRLVDRSKYAAV